MYVLLFIINLDALLILVRLYVLLIFGNFVRPVDIRTVGSSKTLRTVNGTVSKAVHAVDVREPIRPVNSNEIVGTVNSNNPVNSSKPVHPRNSSPGNCLFVLLMFVNL